MVRLASERKSGSCQATSARLSICTTKFGMAAAVEWKEAGTSQHAGRYANQGVVMTIGSISRAAIFAALLMLGCKKNPDPLHIEVADFESPKQLSDTLQYLVGMTEPVVWEAMQRNGFGCGERSGIVVDRSTGKLGSGKPHLECWQS